MLPSGVESKVLQYLSYSPFGAVVQQPVRGLSNRLTRLVDGHRAGLQRHDDSIRGVQVDALRIAEHQRRRHATIGHRCGEVGGAGDVVGDHSKPYAVTP